MGCCASIFNTQNCLRVGFRYFGCLGCPRPYQYVHILTKEQNKVICAHCQQFDGIRFITKQPVSFRLGGLLPMPPMPDAELNTYTIKCGFATDGVSSGFWFSNLLKLNTAIMHDFCYAIHPAVKGICDQVLCPPYRRIAVRLFGRSSWESSGQRGALFVTRDDSGQIWIKVYKDPAYQVLIQSDKLTPEEAPVFNSYFDTN